MFYNMAAITFTKSPHKKSQIYTGSGEYCKLSKTLIKNIGNRVSFKDRFEKLTLEGSVQLP